MRVDRSAAAFYVEWHAFGPRRLQLIGLAFAYFMFSAAAFESRRLGPDLRRERQNTELGKLRSGSRLYPLGPPTLQGANCPLSLGRRDEYAF
jgi:hypothetical protein